MNERISQNISQGQYSVMLPCSPDQFKDFIGGLLGKPQTITQRMSGNFEVGKQELINVHHLLNQRVQEQNHSTLIQFTARIVFDDGSSVLLNSLEDLTTYHEVKPLISVQAHLSWTYLIKFNDRESPEKQVVDVSFITAGLNSIQDEISGLNAIEQIFLRKISGVSFRIQHTARTWGADIQGLLDNHFKSILNEESSVKKAIRRHNGKIVLALCALVWVLAFIGMYRAGSALTNHRKIATEKLIGANVDLVAKFDGILLIFHGNSFENFMLSCLGYIVFAFFVSLIIAMMVEYSANSSKPSFLLLTAVSEKDKLAQLNSYRWKWRSFFGSVVFSLITGVASCIIFENYWKP